MALLVIAVQPASASASAATLQTVAGLSGARRHVVVTFPTWGYVLPMDKTSGSPPSLASVSCTSQHFCAAVDNAGNTLVFEGHAWSRPAFLDVNTYGFTSVSCATPAFCVAVDYDGFETTWTGHRWSAVHSIDQTGTGLSVSCPTVDFCAVVDTYGTGDFWNGKKWTHMTFSTSGGADAISCISSSWCAAGDNTGDVYTWIGKKWSEREVDSGGWINAISCTKGPFCVAAGSDAETFNKSKWSAVQPISVAALDSAACASSKFCMVGDGLGDTYQWNGSSWQKPRTIDPEQSISGLSCPLTTFCAAVDSDGQGLFYAPGPLITTLKLPDGTKSKSYATQLVAEGGIAWPDTWSRVSGGLPPGLTLSAGGKISGKPKGTGTFSFVVHVRDPLGQHSQGKFKITVKS